MPVETVIQKHASKMLKEPKVGVRRDTIEKLQEVGLAANRILNMLPRNGPTLHSKEVAINTRAFALARNIDELFKLIGTLEREQ